MIYFNAATFGAEEVGGTLIPKRKAERELSLIIPIEDKHVSIQQLFDVICERDSYAQKLFDKMPERTFASWNSIVSAYMRDPDEKSALMLFDTMTRYIFLIREKSVLLGDMPLKSGSDIRTAAKLIHDLGPRNVLVKGGDLPNSLDATDIFFDDEEFYELCSSRVNTRNTHGTGYTLASCIAAELAKGSLMLSAVKIAKRYVEAALEYNRDLIIGNGSQGPFDHLLALKNMNQSSCGHDRFNPNVLLLYVVTDSGMNKKWGRPISEAV